MKKFILLFIGILFLVSCDNTTAPIDENPSKLTEEVKLAKDMIEQKADTIISIRISNSLYYKDKYNNLYKAEVLSGTANNVVSGGFIVLSIVCMVIIFILIIIGLTIP